MKRREVLGSWWRERRQHLAELRAYRRERAKVRKAINSVPEPGCTIFQLHRFDDMDYRQIGALMGLTVEEVERHMADALYRIYLQLKIDP